ncbi:putative TetR family transcriptional regulator [Caenibius tardaugens NBRC 16725]|uniref:Putative TetR family transcriptional regulator n=1 Tax=Caenibius tardaugens NBRC 16725 TaxID=1219035 RepID=U2YNF5_9SPHN|nr:TetR/AcrR family transcriptional regulator [Caenibius tardaugens NBRC 16725]GAD50102.1 putative TetR family transcriptional regulator [Caenibius tardaugens NBRC 16725]
MQGGIAVTTEDTTRQNSGRIGRPGGRTERVRKAVADAVIELIRTEGIAFELQAVARLAGVGRATVFRHWPDRASLIGEALAEHTAQLDFPLTGDWKADLHRIAAELRVFLASPAEQAFNRTMFAARNSGFNAQLIAYWTPVIQRIKAPLEEARMKGEIDRNTDVEMVIQTLISTLLVESLVDNLQTETDLGARLVDQLCRGITKPQPGTPDSPGRGPRISVPL